MRNQQLHVVFGTGPVGQATARALVARGHAVRVVNSAWAEQLPPLQAGIIEGVARSGAKLVVVENLYMYGVVEGPLHEGLPCAAHTKKGEVRARRAEAVQTAHRSGVRRPRHTRA